MLEIPANLNEALLAEMQAFAADALTKLKGFVGPEIKINTLKFFYGTNGDFFAQFKRRRFALTRVSFDKKPGAVAILNSVEVAIAMAGYMWSLPAGTIGAKVKAKDFDDELQDIYKEVSSQMFNAVNQRASARDPGALLKFATEDLPANGKRNDLLDDDAYVMMLMDVCVGEQEPAPLYFLFGESVMTAFFDAKFSLGAEASGAAAGPSLGAMPAAKAMIADYPVIDVDDTVGDAYELMEKKDVDCLPVIDEEGRVIRVVTKNNIEIMKSVFFNVPGVEERSARVMCVPLAMVNRTQELVSVGPEDTLAQAARLMVTHRIHAIPVVEDDGAFAGMITALQVLNLLAPYAPSKKASKGAGSRRRQTSAEAPQPAAG